MFGMSVVPCFTFNSLLFCLSCLVVVLFPLNSDFSLFVCVCASICFIKWTIFNLYQQSKGKRLIQCCPLLRYKFKKVTIKSLKLHTCLLPFSLHINCMGDRVMDEFIFILPGLVRVRVFAWRLSSTTTLSSTLDVH